jgi:mannose-6-phosphate isomerase
MQNDPGARLLKGLKPGVTREALADASRRGDVERLIETVPVNEGCYFYLPSGTVHALGAGILVAEVQTPSDTTFRLFDFNRVDPSTGKHRTLHVEQALQCIDFSAPAEASSGSCDSRLVTNPYFRLERFHLHPGAEQRMQSGRPSVLIVTHGILDIGAHSHSKSEAASRGEVVLLPAALASPIISSASGCSWLEVTFPS